MLRDTHDLNEKKKILYFYDSMIRRFDRRFERKKFYNFMIRRFDRRFDDSINDLKEKKLYFHDSMIRRFERRFEKKNFL